MAALTSKVLKTKVKVHSEEFQANYARMKSLVNDLQDKLTMAAISSGR